MTEGPVAPHVLQKTSFEYLFYVGTLLLAVAYFGIYDISMVSREYIHVLSENLRPPWPPFSWLGSYGADVTDSQWYNFTRAVPLVLPFFAAFLYLSHKIRAVAVERMVSALQILHIVSGIALGFAISGPRFLFPILLILGNYYAVKKIYNKVSFTVFMVLMWSSHIAVLFLNSYYEGYKFKWFGLGFLDHLVKPLVAWTVHYNMSVLRMIAFNTDMHDAIVSSEEKREKLLEKHLNCCIECAKICEAYTKKKNGSLPPNIQLEELGCYKLRTEYPRQPSEYNLLSYLGCIVYPPLFIAGPMSSFNAYISHLHNPTMAVDSVDLRRYGIRAFLNLLLLTAVSHYMYIIAILMNGPVFSAISFPRRAVILYLTLAFIWLKFNCVWKLFRLISLVDGVDVPEDMRRCFTNTVSIQGFWRDWHASFNLWIVRYMYIPMGGNKKKHLTIFPIFFFIAIWHDIELRLIHWAGIICVCFVVEIVVTQVLFHPKTSLGILMAQRPLLYRYVRILGACLTMLELIIVNLVGFSIGLDRAGMNLESMWRESSMPFCVLMVFYFYIAASIAIQDRDQEKFNEYQNRTKYGLRSYRRSGSGDGGGSTSSLKREGKVAEYSDVENPTVTTENGIDK
ncbi:GUP1 protein [Trypanosoma theileri]|uniref:GUP1 protein n=1 Tax=Trypanosoma theileri TaxID=67003 RepID=A0A1X0P614_9TRYP|nr:GUP1 protein [Trypanosoma theileri]ORC92376.1 GUP1 protein [Trypanosoma theileri]